MDGIKKISTKELNSLSLAYLGDSVWEKYLREIFLMRNLKVKELNKLVKPYVSAKGQSKIYRKVLEWLEKEESFIAAGTKRARNAKIGTFPKSCTMKEYRDATAFEALIAIAYLEKRGDLIERIIRENILDK